MLQILQASMTLRSVQVVPMNWKCSLSARISSAVIFQV
jgi:hypothetical protein